MIAKEIARLAGVTRSTVTRVINNYPDISNETRMKVMKAIKKYGYVPNSSARALAGKRMKEIGLFLVTDGISSSIFYEEFITHIIEYAENQEYSVLTSLIKPGQYGKMTYFLNSGSIEGAILIGGISDDKEIMELMASKHKIFMVDLISQETELKNFCGIVNPDNYKGAYISTEYLIKNGHKKIMFISGFMGRLPEKERMKGYKQALVDNNIAVDNELILTGVAGDEGVEDLLQKYLNSHSPPTAIFAITDRCAIGVMHVLKANGYKIPHDVSIIGFDDIYLAKEVEPKLTTINSNPGIIAKTAIKKLTEMIETEKKTVSKTLIDVNLIIRESVRKLE